MNILGRTAVGIDLIRIIFLRSLSGYKFKIVEKVLINYITFLLLYSRTAWTFILGETKYSFAACACGS